MDAGENGQKRQSFSLGEVREAEVTKQEGAEEKEEEAVEEEAIGEEGEEEAEEGAEEAIEEKAGKMIKDGKKVEV